MPDHDHDFHTASVSVRAPGCVLAARPWNVHLAGMFTKGTPDLLLFPISHDSAIYQAGQIETVSPLIFTSHITIPRRPAVLVHAAVAYKLLHPGYTV